jgi:hypothetical protein
MKNQTIAQQLKVKEFPFTIKDSKGNKIYYETSDGYWAKKEYDSNGKEIYWENSYRFWEKKEYDSKGNRIYYGNSYRFWEKREYYSNGNQIYYEDSNGIIVDNKPKQVELTMEEIATKFGIDVNNLKIKK